MVEKVITPEQNVVVDFARYAGRNAAGKALVVRACRHCGATLSEGESEDECCAWLLRMRAG